MRTHTIGGVEYQLVAEQRGSDVVVHAERTDNRDRFGVECVGSTEDEAAEKLVRWLEWQSEHAMALDDLQQSERAYHRTIAGSAFTGQGDGPTAWELQKESLDAVERARVRLDEVRARRPE